MPYIADNWFKAGVDMAISDLATINTGAATIPASMWKAGPLNYLLTKLVLKWLGPSPNYERFNGAIGVLESMKLELYRRMVAPYEQEKMEENGDVYVS